MGTTSGGHRIHDLNSTDPYRQGWLNLAVRPKTEVVAIDRGAKAINVHDLTTGRKYREPFDFLILSTGAALLRPANLLAKVGANHPRVVSLRNLDDIDRLKAVVDRLKFMKWGSTRWMETHVCLRTLLSGIERMDQWRNAPASIFGCPILLQEPPADG